LVKEPEIKNEKLLDEPGAENRFRREVGKTKSSKKDSKIDGERTAGLHGFRPPPSTA
jgi:hypothetical protein